MAVYIKDIRIGSFRGIKGLEIGKLKDVNIIAGDNNAGKTSILEAIALLRNPCSFYNVLKVARMREGTFAKNTLYENFISMFPRTEMFIDIEAYSEGSNIGLQLHGKEEGVIREVKSPFPTAHYRKGNEDAESAEVVSFIGELYGRDRRDEEVIPIEYSYLSRPNEYNTYSNVRNIVYVPPGSHLQGNVFNKIIRNESYKEICIRLIQLFDEDIIDLLYLNNENTMRAVEYVKHRKLGIMPLTTYGDGIKKVLSLANSIASAAGGILMIDEIETSINYKYYNDIFSFLIKACRQYDVQMFITTHNIEAIDAILSTQDYEHVVAYDPISVLTFRKDAETSQILSRYLSGEEVFENREKFAFEVRL